MSALQTTDWRAAAAALELPRGMLVDGKTVQAVAGASFTVIGPRNGVAVASLPEGDVADLDRAVLAARRAFDGGSWRNRKPTERKAVLLHVYGSDAPELTVPFGGYKGSGFGRDKSLHALEKYVQLKTVWMAVDSP
jgi:acyl-CoA reductase-like NAD-dependent aldehyde dehydrogenase